MTTRIWTRGAALGLTAFTLLLLPATALGQQCKKLRGDKHTRAADIELSWSRRRDDPQTKQERYRRALSKLEPAFASNPNGARAYLLAAEADLGLRDYVAADSMLDRLEVLAPQCKQVIHDMRFNAWVQQYNLGVSRYQQQDIDGSLKAFETANMILEDVRSLTNAASIYQVRQEGDKAAALYRRAIAAGGDEELVRAATTNLAQLLRDAGKPEEAVKLYAELAARNPDDVLSQINWAVALMDEGQRDSAQALFTTMLSRDDLTFQQWSQVGIGLYRAGDFAEAGTAFSKAHALRPLNKEVLENLANSLYQADSYTKLEAVADTLVQWYPYESVHYNLLANAYRELDRTDDALKVLQRRDALPFEFLTVQLVAKGDNAFTIQGKVMTRSGTEGGQVSIPFEFLGQDGQAAASDELSLALPAAGEAASFELQVQSGSPIFGFRYRTADTSQASGS